jgi:hypothetical protein
VKISESKNLQFASSASLSLGPMQSSKEIELLLLKTDRLRVAFRILKYVPKDF